MSSTTPDPTLLYRCMTKATTAEGDTVRRSLNWVTSRRATLQVWSDRLVCGDWTIPYSEIIDAVLFSYRGSFLISGYVLRVRTSNLTYQFGLNAGRFWRGELPFPVTREKAQLSYSPFSLTIRLILLSYILYEAWKYFRH